MAQERGFSFVSPPYQRCPQCGAEAFGRLWVQPRSYVRKCDACGFTGTFDLPEIRKVLIYLDQFAISGMMKALNPEDPGHERARSEGWFELFEKLDRLSKLQLVVCPESPAHEAESLLYGRGFAELRRLYQLLSHGVRFQDPEQIIGRQLYRHAVDWIAGKATGPLELLEGDAITGRPHAWTDTMQIGVRFPVGEDEIAESRRRREAGAELLEPVFRRWQGEADRRFEDWYKEELDAWPQFVWADFLQSTGRLFEAMRGSGELDIDDLLPRTGSRELVYILMETFTESGVPEGQTLDRVRDLLFSGTLDRLPRLRISSLLWAGVAHEAAHGGRERPPNRGMITDVGVVSSVLPYCDAVMVDGEIRHLLLLGPVRERLGFDPHLFSKSTLPAMLEYLDDIERQAPAELITTVVELYGEPEAFVTIFEGPKERRPRA
jgi:hypothetical protein